MLIFILTPHASWTSSGEKKNPLQHTAYSTIYTATHLAAKIIVLFVILPDLTLDYCIDLITVDF